MRQFLIAALTGAALSFIPSPSRALERLVLRLPFFGDQLHDQPGRCSVDI